MSTRPPHTAPLIDPETLPHATRLDKRKIGAAAMLLVVGGGGYFLWRINADDATMNAQLTTAHDVAESSALGTVPSTSSELRLPSSYAHVSLLPPTAPTPADAEKATPMTVATTPPQENPLTLRERQPVPPPQEPRQATTAPASPTPPVEKPRPSKWLFTDLKQSGGIAEPPFPLPTGEHDRERHSTLFPPAVHERPANPLKVVYRSQVIHGLLQNDLNSEQPGPVRILVTEDIQDKFAQGQVLIPQYSILLGVQADAKIAYGQRRIQVLIESIEQPDGTVIALNRAKAGDTTGATGISGSVNNHWVSLGVSAVLTSLLSVGSRSLAGNTQGYNPTVPQEVATDVSHSVNRTGQDIVKRQLEVPPTLTIPHGTPVTLQLEQNLNLQTDPVVVTR